MSMTPRILLAFCTLAMACAPRALPAVQSSCPAAQEDVLLPCHVTTPPRPVAERQPPRFPDAFRDAGGSGTVRVRYVVDTTGRVRPSSFSIVSSSHELFSWTVRHVSPTWRFTPGEHEGRRVPVVREEQFVFQVAPEDPPFRMVAWSDTTDDGVPRMTIGTPRRDSAGAQLLTAAELLEAQRTVLAELARSATPGQTLCVEVWQDGESSPADAETLRHLSTRDRRAVVPRECPRTYANMFAEPGGPQPPPGWIDPLRLRIENVDPLTRNHVGVTAVARRGMGGRREVCAAERGVDGWAIACSSAFWVH